MGLGFRSVIMALLQPIMESIIFCLQVRTIHSNRVTPMWLPIAHQDTTATGGGTLAGCIDVHLHCSLPLPALSSACRCLNTLSERLSGQAAGGPCASNRARPLENRISP